MRLLASCICVSWVSRKVHECENCRGNGEHSRETHCQDLDTAHTETLSGAEFATSALALISKSHKQ